MWRLKNWKDSAARKAKGAQAVVNIKNGSERDNEVLFNNLLAFDISVLVRAIIKQYIYDLVWYAVRVWVSFHSHFSEYTNSDEKLTNITQSARIIRNYIFSFIILEKKRILYVKDCLTYWGYKDWIIVIWLFKVDLQFDIMI